jgi:hypothetical protein
MLGAADPSFYWAPGLEDWLWEHVASYSDRQQSAASHEHTQHKPQQHQVNDRSVVPFVIVPDQLVD